MTSYEIGDSTFGIYQADLDQVSLRCYVFYGPSQVHYSQEIEGRARGFQRKRNRRPSSPFCGCSSHLLEDIQEDGTNELRYTP